MTCFISTPLLIPFQIFLSFSEERYYAPVYVDVNTFLKGMDSL
jgi:hypothetical protein